MHRCPRPQVAQLAATQRAAEPEQPQPQCKFHGITKRRGKHNSQVYVPRTQVDLLPEALRRTRKDGLVKLCGGTYSTAEEAAHATDK